MTNASRGSNPATFLALFGIMIVAGGLLGLMAMVHPPLLGLLLVPLAFVLLGTVNYLVWGWWISAITIDDDELDD